LRDFGAGKVTRDLFIIRGVPRYRTDANLSLDADGKILIGTDNADYRRLIGLMRFVFGVSAIPYLRLETEHFDWGTAQIATDVDLYHKWTPSCLDAPSVTIRG